MGMKFAIANLSRFQQELENADRKRIKAVENATKVEAFRLMKAMKQEIAAGAPGGQPLSPLTEMAKRLRSRRLRYKRSPNKPPLYMLAPWVRYKVERDGGEYKVSVGFVGGGGLSKRKLTALTSRPQRGGTQQVTDPLIHMLLKHGAKNKRKRLHSLFLRKSTRTLKTPPRPIIGPFWKAHEHEARRNIMINFERKMRGEYI